MIIPNNKEILTKNFLFLKKQKGKAFANLNRIEEYQDLLSHPKNPLKSIQEDPIDLVPSISNLMQFN